MLRGISRVSSQHTRESVLKYFMDMFSIGYLNVVFPEGNMDYFGIHVLGDPAFAAIMKDKNKGIALLVRTLIDKVMKEKGA